MTEASVMTMMSKGGPGDSEVRLPNRAPSLVIVPALVPNLGLALVLLISL